jgi:hypothetical protein
MEALQPCNTLLRGYCMNQPWLTTRGYCMNQPWLTTIDWPVSAVLDAPAK